MSARTSSLLLLVVLVVALAACLTPSASAAPTSCIESGGAKINLSGNHGFCYLVGRRMRKGSIFAQCKNGVLTCFADEGIPDKPTQAVDCVAPEPGNCGSGASTPAAANANASESVSGDAEFVERTRSNALADVNPSALVAGNKEIPGLDDDDDDDE